MQIPLRAFNLSFRQNLIHFKFNANSKTLESQKYGLEMVFLHQATKYNCNHAISR